MRASDWVATAPTPSRTAGTMEPTARNRLATATPQASPSRAAMEKVMGAAYGGRIAGARAGRWTRDGRRGEMCRREGRESLGRTASMRGRGPQTTPRIRVVAALLTGLGDSRCLDGVLR